MSAKLDGFTLMYQKESYKSYLFLNPLSHRLHPHYNVFVLKRRPFAMFAPPIQTKTAKTLKDFKNNDAHTHVWLVMQSKNTISGVVLHL